MSLLEKINSPEDVKKLSEDQLPKLCGEIRDQIIAVTSKNGGHLASSLGAVELIVALLRQYDLEGGDKIIFDVGHQAYAYKLLTGRRDRFNRLRTEGGISGFLKRSESSYDFFGAGHSSTSLSAALGYAVARDLEQGKNHVLAVIGDGAIMNGMALEALNHAGTLKSPVTFILNDNGIAISPRVGGMAIHLAQLSTSGFYRKFKKLLKKLCRRFSNEEKIIENLEGIKRNIKQLISYSNMFDDMGLTYWGPFDGHNLAELEQAFALAKQYDHPLLIHVITQKGKGYADAENNPVKYHGLSPMEKKKGEKSWSQAAATVLEDMAEKDRRLLVMTPAMCEGSALGNFAKKFPDRFFDVGIAEEHMMTFAAGLAAGGMRPVACFYSTFLQRAMDQLVHDICIQNLPVIIAVDRAGLVGEDGETHQGLFELNWCSVAPNLKIWSPSDQISLERCFREAMLWNGPSMIRYPRGEICQNLLGPWRSSGSLHRSAVASSWTVIAQGPAFELAQQAQILAKQRKIEVPELICLEQLSPIPWDELKPLLENRRLVVTVEENYLLGGMGERIGAMVASVERACQVKSIGVDRSFVAPGTPEQQRQRYGLTAERILECYERK